MNVAPAQPASMNTMGDRKMSTGKFNTTTERREPTKSSGNFGNNVEKQHEDIEESQLIFKEK